ncbi:predicted protein [Lichtheimia corymbifera JMRC:FSU:9682]|uniref:Uncharacterized protein n=1 Tax=Lichtheimia corymbifera JMRC:FSU:9682 TaxID=1263082 RepID=A0A068RW92_9FUNG|nr:predicted protein [Lichtheimia corymbifera JMRC:FSU:9682]
MATRRPSLSTTAMDRSKFFKESERLDFATYLSNTHDQYKKDSIKAVGSILRDYNNDLDQWFKIAPDHQKPLLGALKRRYTRAELKKLMDSRNDVNQPTYQTAVQGDVHNLSMGPTFNVSTHGGSSSSSPDKNKVDQEQHSSYVNHDQKSDDADLLANDEGTRATGLTNDIHVSGQGAPSNTHNMERRGRMERRDQAASYDEDMVKETLMYNATWMECTSRLNHLQRVWSVIVNAALMNMRYRIGLLL